MMSGSSKACSEAKRSPSEPTCARNRVVQPPDLLGSQQQTCKVGRQAWQHRLTHTAQNITPSWPTDCDADCRQQGQPTPAVCIQQCQAQAQAICKHSVTYALLLQVC